MDDLKRKARLQSLRALKDNMDDGELERVRPPAADLQAPADEPGEVPPLTPEQIDLVKAKLDELGKG